MKIRILIFFRLDLVFFVIRIGKNGVDLRDNIADNPDSDNGEHKCESRFESGSDETADSGPSDFEKSNSDPASEEYADPD